jgi:hypothetical protein
MAPLTVSLHFVPPYIEYWQMPCYTLSFLVMSMTISTSIIMFRSLSRAAALLNNSFKVRKSNNFMHEENYSIQEVSTLKSYLLLYFPWEITSFNTL